MPVTFMLMATICLRMQPRDVIFRKYFGHAAAPLLSHGVGGVRTTLLIQEESVLSTRTWHSQTREWPPAKKT